MFGIGLPELIVIMGIALVVVGPDKLPELAKSLAKGIGELKRAAGNFKESLEEETKPLNEAIDEQAQLADIYQNVPKGVEEFMAEKEEAGTAEEAVQAPNDVIDQTFDQVDMSQASAAPAPEPEPSAEPPTEPAPQESDEPEEPQAESHKS